MTLFLIPYLIENCVELAVVSLSRLETKTSILVLHSLSSSVPGKAISNIIYTILFNNNIQMKSIVEFETVWFLFHRLVLRTGFLNNTFSILYLTEIQQLNFRQTCALV